MRFEQIIKELLKGNEVRRQSDPEVIYLIDEDGVLIYYDDSASYSRNMFTEATLTKGDFKAEDWEWRPRFNKWTED